MIKIQIFASESAEKTEVDSLLSVLTVLLLKVEGNDTAKAGLNEDLKKWVKESASYAKALGVGKQLGAMTKTYLLKDEVDDLESRELGETLKEKRPLLKVDNTVSKEQVAFFNDLSVCLALINENASQKSLERLNKGIENAWLRITKNIALLKSPRLTTLYAPEEVTTVGKDVKDAVAKAKTLMKKLTGDSSSIFLHQKDRTELMKDASKASVLADYSATMKLITPTIKPAIQAYVRNSGKELVSIDVLRAELDRVGQPNNLPIGFIGGQIDEKGKMYTKEGLQLDKEPFGKVAMNPKYSPDTNSTYVLQGIYGSRRWGDYRTIVMNQSNKQHRHLKIQEFFDHEAENRAKWINVLKTSTDRSQVLAAMTELMYQTSARIGGKDNATKDVETYGLTTLQVRHTEFLPKAIKFNYSGKKSHDQEHVYPTTKAEAKIVRKVMETLVKGKGPNELVFTWNNKPVTDAMARKFLTELGISISPHKFRHLAGTKMAQAILKTLPFKKSDNPTQAAVEKWIKKAFLPIGAHLHHANLTTGEVVSTTALKSYIDPELVANVFAELGLRRPNFIPK